MWRWCQENNSSVYFEGGTYNVYSPKSVGEGYGKYLSNLNFQEGGLPQFTFIFTSYVRGRGMKNMLKQSGRVEKIYQFKNCNPHRPLSPLSTTITYEHSLSVTIYIHTLFSKV
jgi:hypothetical protein